MQTSLRYNQMYQNTIYRETSFDPTGAMGLMIAEQLAAPHSDPLDILIALEERVQEEYGLTLIQYLKQQRDGVIDI